MKIFTGFWWALKSGLFGAFFGALVGIVAAAGEQLFGLEMMPHRVMAHAYLGIIGIEWLARLLRGAYEGWHDKEVEFWSRLLQSLLENVTVTIFYLFTAASMQLFSIMFQHRPESVFYVASRAIKSAAFFGLALMSITFTIVQLRREEGAQLFFRRLKAIMTAPKDSIDAFVEEPEEA